MEKMINRKSLLTAAVAILVLGGCKSKEKSEYAQTTNTGMHTESPTTGYVATDNTKMNERIDNRKEWTAQDQGNSESDLKITQMIRQQVVDQKNFSTYAKNVKIITNNGLVVLKGPVSSLAEKNKIESFAIATAGRGKVLNQMTVTK